MNGETGQVLLELREDVAYVTLDAPPLNILTAALMGRLADALDRIAADRSLKAVAVTANGKAFSAGADVAEHQPEAAPLMIAAFSRLFHRFGTLQVPVVMGVDGAALGAGFELALMADVLLATERATFGQPEIRLGFFAPLGVAWLPALVGSARAIEITASGRTYGAAEMQRFGLVSQVLAVEQLPAAVEAVLEDFRRASPLVMQLNVRLIRQLRGRPFEEARCTAEKVFLEELMPTQDVREGIASFFAKRKPEWKNC